MGLSHLGPTTLSTSVLNNCAPFPFNQSLVFLFADSSYKAKNIYQRLSEIR